MNVLFVCTGNTCRSPMAEHLFKKMATDADLNSMTVRSAGITPAHGLTFPKEAREALQKEGIESIQHEPKGLNESMVKEADIILTMESHHRNSLIMRYQEASEKTHLLKKYADESAGETGVDDPFGGALEEYISTLGEIKESLIKIINKIKSSNDSGTKS